MELREYQKSLFENIIFKSKLVDKLCVQLSTGGGKTVIFTKLIEHFNTHTLVLVDSKELIEQTYNTFKKIGLDVATFESKNKIFPPNKVVVSMAQTLFNRVQKKETLLHRFKYLIVDEAHVWVFNKLFDYVPNAKILGFTATPVRLKRHKFHKCNQCKNEQEFVKDTDPYCCGYEMKIWTKEESMSEVYDDISVGVGVDYLIENNFLVDEELYVIDVDNSKLKTDSSGEFTNKSIAENYDKEEVQIDILHNYMELCKGKKTMIFNANTKTNLAIYDLFKENDINAKMYDSVNSNNKERNPLIEWFKNERDAVLLNVGCFTKGFDVSDVECIILARPTASLSLFIQIAGRGARITNKIFKDRFIFIDGGGNSDRFGMWSEKTRDWNKIFFHGFKPPKQLKEQLDDVTECIECDITILKSDVNCPVCGALQIEDEQKKGEGRKEKVISDNKIKATKIKTIYPKGIKIVAYVNSINESINFAFKILINQTFDLFVNYKISKGNFENTLNNGVFKKRINKIMGEPFIYLINNLESKSNRTLQYLRTKLITKLNNYYDKI